MGLAVGWRLIDGSIGEASMFHDTFGYYAQGVVESTAQLPAGWQERLVPILFSYGSFDHTTGASVGDRS